MTTDPSIDDSISGVIEGRHGGEPVVAVQDAQTERIRLQDNGDRHAACTCYVIAGTEKLVSTVRDICDSCIEAAHAVVLDNGTNNAVRAWVEAGRREGKFAPFPRELSDRFDALTVEHCKPALCLDGVNDVSVNIERPSVPLD